MTAKVDEILDSIPLLEININEIFDFKDKCIDQMAIDIISESLDYALETSVRRLESVAKINPTIREAAVQNILPAVKTLRDLVLRAPACPTSALGAAPLKSPPVKPKRTTTKKVAAPEKLLKNITESVKKAAPKTTAKTVKVTEEQKDALENVKDADLVLYEKVQADRAAGKTLKEAVPGAILENKGIVGVGKQFTIKFNGSHKKYHIVSKEAYKDVSQTPVEAGVEKISESSKFAKGVIGMESGDNKPIELDGKTWNAQVLDVKEGLIKYNPHLLIKEKE